MHTLCIHKKIMLYDPINRSDTNYWEKQCLQPKNGPGIQQKIVV